MSAYNQWRISFLSISSLLGVLVNLVVAWSVGVHRLASVTLVWRTDWSHLGRSVGVVPVDWDLDGGGNGEKGENGGQLHFCLAGEDRCFDEDKV